MEAYKEYRDRAKRAQLNEDRIYELVYAMTDNENEADKQAAAFLAETIRQQTTPLGG